MFQLFTIIINTVLKCLLLNPSFQYYQYYYCIRMSKSSSLKNSANALKFIFLAVSGLICPCQSFLLCWTAECCLGAVRGGEGYCPQFLWCSFPWNHIGMLKLCQQMCWTFISIFPQLLFYSHFYQALLLIHFLTNWKCLMPVQKCVVTCRPSSVCVYMYVCNAQRPSQK